MLSDRVIQEIATGHGKTAAPVGLKWLIQQLDIGVVPRALEVSEIEENIDLFDFELSEAEEVRVCALRNKNFRIVDPVVRRPVWDEGLGRAKPLRHTGPSARRSISRCMNFSHSAICSRVTNSSGLWACSILPGPQMTVGMPACFWNNPASVPNATLP
jgi:hypothetical protein